MFTEIIFLHLMIKMFVYLCFIFGKNNNNKKIWWWRLKVVAVDELLTAKIQIDRYRCMCVCLCVCFTLLSLVGGLLESNGVWTERRECVFWTVLTEGNGLKFFVCLFCSFLVRITPPTCSFSGPGILQPKELKKQNGLRWCPEFYANSSFVYVRNTMRTSWKQEYGIIFW